MSMSHAVSGWASESPTPAQLKEFFSQIDSGRITKGRLQAFLRGETTDKGIEQRKEEWAEFYQKYFGIELDFSNIRIPKRQSGFDRLIIVARGLTLNQVYSVLAKHVPCWRYTDDLDKAVTSNDRDPKDSTYAIWVRDRQEADEENKNLSANQLKEQDCQGITLLERLFYELKYWDETKKRLDVDNLTLCTGSRDGGGRVPGVDWRSDYRKVYVNWYSLDSANDYLRSRSVVS